ncbi:MAG: hypothetical protein KGJ13_12765, partial [Patescibacteria group bacterium]|nr:hypothetical protein [Patescibacteria group bacterium]
MPSTFSITGSPCTSGSCAFSVSYSSFAHNGFLAGPSTGGAGAPTVRAIVTADIPTGTSGAAIGLLNTNKTDSGSDTFSNILNVTGAFQISGSVQTFPASGQIVGTTDTQTLTNKSIAASEINSGTIAQARLPVGSNSQQGILQVDGTTITASGGIITAIATYPPGYINGCAASNDGTTPTTVLDIATCSATDSTNSLLMKTTSGFTKTISGTFVAGTGNAGMGTGLTVAASTWYHVFEINCSGTPDFYFDTSTTAANKPACASAYRYVADFKTNASSQIVGFFQNGQEILYAAAVTDVSAGGSTTATLTTLTTPLGITTYPIISITTTNVFASFWSPILGSAFVSQTVSSSGNIFLPPTQLTNTSSQL